MKDKDKIIDETIDELLENFNWEKVHQTMKILDWKWVSSKTESGVPSIGELFTKSRKMLYDVVSLADQKKEDCLIATGGFIAYAFYDNSTKQIYHLKLAFEVTSWNIDIDNKL